MIARGLGLDMDMKKLLGLGVVTLVAAIGAGCSVEDTRIPDLAGPSELGLRVALQAVPDSILQDGFSQAALQIEATTADGRAARNLTLRIQSFVDGIGRRPRDAVRQDRRDGR